MMKLPNKPPWWANIVFVCAFIGAGFLAYNEMFPDPKLTQLQTDFKVHEVTPAHGIKEIKKELQTVQIIVQVLVDDMSEFEDEQKEQTTLLYEIKRNTQ